MNQILSLVLALFLVSPLAFASEGDVCNLRPDLCDEGGGTPEPEVAESIRPAKPRKVMRPAAQKRKLKPRKASRRTSSNANCRVAGQPYNLNNVDLPVCKSADVAEVEPEQTRKPAAKKARRSPASVDIDSYMNSNANHPAFASRMAERQRAFQDPVPRPVASTVAPGEPAAPSSTTAAPSPAPTPAAGY